MTKSQHLLQRRPMVPWGALVKNIASRLREVILPWRGHSMSMDLVERLQQGATNTSKGQEERLRELGLLSLQNRKAQGRILPVYINI